MNLAVLHLSDAHFFSPNQFNDNKITRISSALSEIGNFDELVICFTGDISYCGKGSEYSIARQFFRTLFIKLRENYNLDYINCYFVPGNHDYIYSGEERTRQRLKNIHESSDFDDFIKFEEKNMHNFFQFAQRFYCFEKSFFVDFKEIVVDNKKIRFNLINSAPFSDICSDDKGIHLIPDQYIDNLNYCNSSLTISLMHHPLSWLADECKQKLKKTLQDGTNILLLGHEHDPSGTSMNVDETSRIEVIAGGMLSNKEDQFNSCFNALNIDLNSCKIKGYRLNWNETGKVYVSKPILDTIFVTKNINRLCLRDDFHNELLSDSVNHISSSFRDYYVFPNLEKCETDEFVSEYNIYDYDTFFETLCEKKIILIEGDDNIGKSSLAKYVFLKLYESMTPLLITTENINGRSIEKVIQRAFEDQYSDKEESYAIYKQLEISSKVAIIDDIHLFKQETAKKLIEYLKENFGYVILFSKIQWEFDILKMVKEKVESTTKDDYNIARLQIDPFYSDKRKELIHKVCRLLNNAGSGNSNISEKQINQFVNSQFRLFESTPDFLIKYIAFVFSQNNDTHNNNQSLFSKVFEANIINAIRETKTKASVDEVLVVLDEVAHFIHFNKKYPLGHEEYINIIKKYNEEYRMTIDSFAFLNCVTDAKIIKCLKSDNGSTDLVFSNNNYLAFFVARRLNRKFNEDGSFADIEYVLKHICFGINGDILLFISSQTNNLQILKSIYREVENLIKDWSQFSTDKDSCLFFNEMSALEPIAPPTADDKNELESKNIEREKKLRQEEVIETTNIYNYDETEVNEGLNIIIKAISLTKMIAKILPNFYHMLPRQQKDDFAKAIFVNPNKIINRILMPIYDNFDEIVDNELSILEDNGDSELKRAEIEFFIHDISLMMTLSIYDSVGSFAINDKTKDLLTNEPELIKSEANRIQRLMILENGNYIDAFIIEAEDIYKNAKLPFVKIMITNIVKKLLLTHDNISQPNYDRLFNKYFSPLKKKAFLLQNAQKNRIIVNTKINNNCMKPVSSCHIYD